MPLEGVRLDDDPQAAIDQVRTDVESELAARCAPGVRPRARVRRSRWRAAPTRTGCPTARPRGRPRVGGAPSRDLAQPRPSRGAGRRGSRRAAPSQRRPAPRRTAVAVRTSRASSSRSWRAPRPASSSRSVHVSVMRVRRASSIRRSLGTATWGTAGTTLTFQPWARAAETRHTWPVDHEGELGALVDAGHGVAAPVDPHELAGRERRLERSSRGQAHQQVARRHATEDRHQVRDLHPPSVAQRQARPDRSPQAVVRTEQTDAGAQLTRADRALAGRSVRSTRQTSEE